MRRGRSGRATPRGWRDLSRVAGVLLMLLLAGTGVALRDLEALAFAGVVGVALLLLLFGRELLGTAALGLLSLNTAGWMVPGALSNLRHGDGLAAIMLPAAIAITALTALVAAVGSLLRRGEPDAGGSAARWVGAGALATLLAAAAVSFAAADRAVGVPGEIELVMENTAFSETDIVVGAGRSAVRVRNGDLFWHTFTIPDLGVDVRVPVKARRSAAFDAPAGVYEFICAIPGHTQAGMRGTLTVE